MLFTPGHAQFEFLTGLAKLAGDAGAVIGTGSTRKAAADAATKSTTVAKKTASKSSKFSLFANLRKFKRQIKKQGKQAKDAAKMNEPTVLKSKADAVFDDMMTKLSGDDFQDTFRRAAKYMGENSAAGKVHLRVTPPNKPHIQLFFSGKDGARRGISNIELSDELAGHLLSNKKRLEQFQGAVDRKLHKYRYDMFTMDDTFTLNIQTTGRTVQQGSKKKLTYFFKLTSDSKRIDPEDLFKKILGDSKYERLKKQINRGEDVERASKEIQDAIDDFNKVTTDIQERQITEAATSLSNINIDASTLELVNGRIMGRNAKTGEIQDVTYLSKITNDADNLHPADLDGFVVRILELDLTPQVDPKFLDAVDDMTEDQFFDIAMTEAQKATNDALRAKTIDAPDIDVPVGAKGPKRRNTLAGQVAARKMSGQIADTYKHTRENLVKVHKKMAPLKVNEKSLHRSIKKKTKKLLEKRKLKFDMSKCKEPISCKKYLESMQLDKLKAAKKNRAKRMEIQRENALNLQMDTSQNEAFVDSQYFMNVDSNRMQQYVGVDTIPPRVRNMNPADQANAFLKESVQYGVATSAAAYKARHADFALKVDQAKHIDDTVADLKKQRDLLKAEHGETHPDMDDLDERIKFNEFWQKQKNDGKLYTEDQITELWEVTKKQTVATDRKKYATLIDGTPVSNMQLGDIRDAAADMTEQIHAADRATQLLTLIKTSPHKRDWFITQFVELIYDEGNDFLLDLLGDDTRKALVKSIDLDQHIFKVGDDNIQALIDLDLDLWQNTYERYLHKKDELTSIVDDIVESPKRVNEIADGAEIITDSDKFMIEALKFDEVKVREVKMRSEFGQEQSIFFVSSTELSDVKKLQEANPTSTVVVEAKTLDEFNNLKNQGIESMYIAQPLKNRKSDHVVEANSLEEFNELKGEGLQVFFREGETIHKTDNIQIADSVSEFDSMLELRPDGSYVYFPPPEIIKSDRVIEVKTMDEFNFLSENSEYEVFFRDGDTIHKSSGLVFVDSQDEFNDMTKLHPGGGFMFIPEIGDVVRTGDLNRKVTSFVETMNQPKEVIRMAPTKEQWNDPDALQDFVDNMKQQNPNKVILFDLNSMGDVSDDVLASASANLKQMGISTVYDPKTRDGVVDFDWEPIDEVVTMTDADRRFADGPPNRIVFEADGAATQRLKEAQDMEKKFFRDQGFDDILGPSPSNQNSFFKREIPSDSVYRSPPPDLSITERMKWVQDNMRDMKKRFIEFRQDLIDQRRLRGITDPLSPPIIPTEDVIDELVENFVDGARWMKKQMATGDYNTNLRLLNEASDALRNFDIDDVTIGTRLVSKSGKPLTPDELNQVSNIRKKLSQIDSKEADIDRLYKKIEDIEESGRKAASSNFHREYYNNPKTQALYKQLNEEVSVIDGEIKKIQDEIKKSFDNLPSDVNDLDDLIEQRRLYGTNMETGQTEDLTNIVTTTTNIDIENARSGDIYDALTSIRKHDPDVGETLELQLDMTGLVSKERITPLTAADIDDMNREMADIMKDIEEWERVSGQLNTLKKRYNNHRAGAYGFQSARARATIAAESKFIRFKAAIADTINKVFTLYIPNAIYYATTLSGFYKALKWVFGWGATAVGHMSKSDRLLRTGHSMRAAISNHPHTTQTMLRAMADNGASKSKLAAWSFAESVAGPTTLAYKATKSSGKSGKRIAEYLADRDRTESMSVSDSEATYLSEGQKPKLFGSSNGEEVKEGEIFPGAGPYATMATGFIAEMLTNIELPINQDNFIGVRHEDMTKYEIQMVPGERIVPKHVEHFVTWQWESDFVETYKHRIERESALKIKYKHLSVEVEVPCNHENLLKCDLGPGACSDIKFCQRTCWECRKDIIDRRAFQNRIWGSGKNRVWNENKDRGEWEAMNNYLQSKGCDHLMVDSDESDYFKQAFDIINDQTAESDVEEKKLFLNYYCGRTASELEDCIDNGHYERSSLPYMAVLLSQCYIEGDIDDVMTGDFMSDYDLENSYSFWQFEEGPWGPNHNYLKPGGDRHMFYNFLIFERNMGRPAAFEWKAQHRLIKGDTKNELISDFDLSFLGLNAATSTKCKIDDSKYDLTERVGREAMELFFDIIPLFTVDESEPKRSKLKEYVTDKNAFKDAFKNHKDTTVYSSCVYDLDKYNQTDKKTGRIRTREIWPDQSTHDKKIYDYNSTNTGNLMTNPDFFTPSVNMTKKQKYAQAYKWAERTKSMTDATRFFQPSRWPCKQYLTGFVPGTMSSAFFVKEVRFPTAEYEVHTMDDYMLMNIYRFAANFATEGFQSVTSALVSDLSVDIALKDTETWRRIIDIFLSNRKATEDDEHFYKDYKSKCYVSYYAQPEGIASPSLYAETPVCFKVDGYSGAITETPCIVPQLTELKQQSSTYDVYGLDLSTVTSISPGAYMGYVKRCFDGIVDGNECTESTDVLTPGYLDFSAFSYHSECRIISDLSNMTIFTEKYSSETYVDMGILNEKENPLSIEYMNSSTASRQENYFMDDLVTNVNTVISQNVLNYKIFRLFDSSSLRSTSNNNDHYFFVNIGLDDNINGLYLVNSDKRVIKSFPVQAHGLRVKNVTNNNELHFIYQTDKSSVVQFFSFVRYDYGTCNQILNLNTTYWDHEASMSSIGDLLSNDWYFSFPVYYVDGLLRNSDETKTFYGTELLEYAKHKNIYDIAVKTNAYAQNEVNELSKSITEVEKFYKEINVDPDHVRHEADKRNADWLYKQSFAKEHKIETYLRTVGAAAAGALLATRLKSGGGILSKAAWKGKTGKDKMSMQEDLQFNVALAAIGAYSAVGTGLSLGVQNAIEQDRCAHYAKKMNKNNYNCYDLENDLSKKRADFMDDLAKASDKLVEDVFTLELLIPNSKLEYERAYKNIQSKILDPCLDYIIGPGRISSKRLIPQSCDIGNLDVRVDLSYTITGALNFCDTSRQYGVNNEFTCIKGTANLLKPAGTSHKLRYGRTNYEMDVTDTPVVSPVYYMVGETMDTIFGYSNTLLDGENRTITINIRNVLFPAIKNVVFNSSNFYKVQMGQLENVEFRNSILREVTFWHTLTDVKFMATGLDSLIFMHSTVFGEQEYTINRVTIQDSDFICGTDFRFVSLERITFINVKGCTILCDYLSTLCMGGKYILHEEVIPNGYDYKNENLTGVTTNGVSSKWLNVRLLSCPTGSNVHCDPRYPVMLRYHEDLKYITYNRFPKHLDLTGNDLSDISLSENIIQGDLLRADVFGISGKLKKCPLYLPQGYECKAKRIVGPGVHIENENIDILFSNMPASSKHHITTRNVSCETFCKFGVFANNTVNFEDAEFVGLNSCPIDRHIRGTYGKPKTDVSSFCTEDIGVLTSNNIMYVINGDTNFDRKTRVNLHDNWAAAYESRFRGSLVIQNGAVTNANLYNSIYPTYVCDTNNSIVLMGNLLQIFNSGDKYCLIKDQNKRISAHNATTTDSFCESCVYGNGEMFCGQVKFSLYKTYPTFTGRNLKINADCRLQTNIPTQTLPDWANSYNQQNIICPYYESKALSLCTNSTNSNTNRRRLIEYSRVDEFCSSPYTNLNPYTCKRLFCESAHLRNLASIYTLMVDEYRLVEDEMCDMNVSEFVSSTICTYDQAEFVRGQVIEPFLTRDFTLEVWDSTIHEYGDVGLVDGRYISRLFYPRNPNVELQNVEPRILWPDDSMNLGPVLCTLDPLWEDELSFVVDFHRSHKASISLNAKVFPLYMYYHGNTLIQPKRVIESVTSETYPYVVERSCDLQNKHPSYFETRFGAEDGFDEYPYRRCENVHDPSAMCTLTGEGVNFSNVHFFNDNERFIENIDTYDPDVPARVLYDVEYWRGIDIPMSWGYRKVSLYPGDVKSCPNNGDSNWGLSPVFHDGGSRCLFNNETKRGMFFGPNVVIQPKYVQCKIIGKNVRRVNPYDEVAWTSPVDVNEEISLDQNSTDIEYLLDQNLKVTSFDGEAARFSRTDTVYSDVHMRVTDCELIDEKPQTNDIVMTTYDPMSKKIRNVRCVLLNNFFDYVSLGNFMEEIPNAVYDLEIHRMECTYMYTEDEEDVIADKLAQCNKDDDLKYTSACMHDGKLLTEAEIRSKELSLIFNCSSGVCDFGPMFENHVPNYMEFQRSNDTIRLRYNALFENPDLSGVDLSGANLFHMNLQGRVTQLHNCPAIPPPGFTCSRTSDDNPNDFTMFNDNGCGDFKQAVRTYDNGNYVQPYVYGVHRNDHFNPSYMLKNVRSTLSNIEWEDLLVDKAPFSDEEDFFATYAGKTNKDSNISTQQKGVLFSMITHFNVTENTYEELDMEYELTHRNSKYINIPEDIRYGSCPIGCLRCDDTRCYKWSNDINIISTKLDIVTCLPSTLNCSEGGGEYHLDPDDQYYIDMDTKILDTDQPLEYLWKQTVPEVNGKNVTVNNMMVSNLDVCEKYNDGRAKIRNGFSRQLFTAMHSELYGYNASKRVSITYDHRCSESKMIERDAKLHADFCSLEPRYCTGTERSGLYKTSLCPPGALSCDGNVEYSQTAKRATEDKVKRRTLYRQTSARCPLNCDECKGDICTRPKDEFFIHLNYHRGAIMETILKPCKKGCRVCTSFSMCKIPKTGYGVRYGQVFKCKKNACAHCSSPETEKCLSVSQGGVLHIPTKPRMKEIVNSSSDACGTDGILTVNGVCMNKHTPIMTGRNKKWCPLDKFNISLDGNQSFGFMFFKHDYAVKNNGVVFNGYPRQKRERIDYTMHDIKIGNDQDGCESNTHIWHIDPDTIGNYVGPLKDKPHYDDLELGDYYRSNAQKHDGYTSFKAIKFEVDDSLKVVPGFFYCILPKDVNIYEKFHSSFDNDNGKLAHTFTGLQRVRKGEVHSRLQNDMDYRDVSPCFADLNYIYRYKPVGTTFEFPSEWIRYWENTCIKAGNDDKNAGAITGLVATYAIGYTFAGPGAQPLAGYFVSQIGPDMWSAKNGDKHGMDLYKTQLDQFYVDPTEYPYVYFDANQDDIDMSLYAMGIDIPVNYKQIDCTAHADNNSTDPLRHNCSNQPHVKQKLDAGPKTFTGNNNLPKANEIVNTLYGMYDEDDGDMDNYMIFIDGDNWENKVDKFIFENQIKHGWGIGSEFRSDHAVNRLEKSQKLIDFYTKYSATATFENFPQSIFCNDTHVEHNLLINATNEAARVLNNERDRYNTMVNDNEMWSAKWQNQLQNNIWYFTTFQNNDYAFALNNMTENHRQMVLNWKQHTIDNDMYLRTVYKLPLQAAQTDYNKKSDELKNFENELKNFRNEHSDRFNLIANQSASDENFESLLDDDVCYDMFAEKIPVRYPRGYCEDTKFFNENSYHEVDEIMRHLFPYCKVMDTHFRCLEYFDGFVLNSDGIVIPDYDVSFEGYEATAMPTEHKHTCKRGIQHGDEFSCIEPLDGFYKILTNRGYKIEKCDLAEAVNDKAESGKCIFDREENGKKYVKYIHDVEITTYSETDFCPKGCAKCHYERGIQRCTLEQLGFHLLKSGQIIQCKHEWCDICDEHGECIVPAFGYYMKEVYETDRIVPTPVIRSMVEKNCVLCQEPDLVPISNDVGTTCIVNYDNKTHHTMQGRPVVSIEYGECSIRYCEKGCAECKIPEHIPQLTAATQATFRYKEFPVQCVRAQPGYELVTVNEPCPEGCATCSSIGECYTLQEGWGWGLNLDVIKCGKNCAACEPVVEEFNAYTHETWFKHKLNSIRCTRFKDGFFVNQTVDADEGLIHDVIPCVEGCFECDGPGWEDCLKANQTYFVNDVYHMYGDSPYVQDMQGDVVDSSCEPGCRRCDAYQQCIEQDTNRCDPACDICDSRTRCWKAKEGFYLQVLSTKVLETKIVDDTTYSLSGIIKFYFGDWSINMLKDLYTTNQISLWPTMIDLTNLLYRYT